MCSLAPLEGQWAAAGLRLRLRTNSFDRPVNREMYLIVHPEESETLGATRSFSGPSVSNPRAPCFVAVFFTQSSETDTGPTGASFP